MCRFVEIRLVFLFNANIVEFDDEETESRWNATTDQLVVHATRPASVARPMTSPAGPANMKATHATCNIILNETVVYTETQHFLTN